MSKVRKFVFSEVQGYDANDSTFPNGTVALHEDGNVRIHDGSTVGGKKFIPTVITDLPNDAGFITDSAIGNFTFANSTIESSSITVKSNVQQAGYQYSAPNVVQQGPWSEYLIKISLVDNPDSTIIQPGAIVTGPGVTTEKIVFSSFEELGDWTVVIYGPGGENDVDGTIFQTGATYTFTSPDYSVAETAQWQFGSNGSIVFPDNTIQSTAFTGQISSENELQIVDNFTSIEYDCSTVTKFYHSLPTETWDINFANIGTTANTSSVVTLYIEQGPTPFLPSNIAVNGNAVSVSWSGNLTGNADTVDVLNYTVLNVSGNIKVLGWTDVLFYLGQ